NGRPARARDVQVLFADNGSGHGSPAMVGQGRIGLLISAKPGDRRAILEEAAGITGLHSRRHEAELKLRAAEGNLTRLEDVIRTMDGTLQGLKKQARQAARYRSLTEQIRRAEAIILHARWVKAKAEEAAARAGFAAADAKVAELMREVAAATTAQTEAAADLPALRQAEAEAAAALQRLMLAREGLAAEERRIQQATAEAEKRLSQLGGDIDREQALARDAGHALARLAEERARIQEVQAGELEDQAEARELAEEIKAQVEELDAQLAALTAQVAGDEARRGALTRQLADVDARLGTLQRRLAEAQRDRMALAAELGDAGEAAATEAAAAFAQAALEHAQSSVEEIAERRQAAEGRLAEAREAQAAAQAALAKLRAEEGALAELLAAGGGKGKDGRALPPVLDSIAVAAGYEGALGAAFGDDLSAPLDPAAPVHWRELPPLDDGAELPPGAAPLAAQVQAPPALTRRLGRTGVVADAAAAEAAAGALRPGQQLVSPDGGLWRWDGLVQRAGAPTAAAVRLKQRNRLAELRAQIDGAAAAAERAAALLTESRAAAHAAAEGERTARSALTAAVADLGRARDRHAKAVQAQAAAASRLAALAETESRLSADRDELAAQREELAEGIESLPDDAAGRARLEALRATLADRRRQAADRQAAFDRLTREAHGRRHRLNAILDEERSWQNRAGGAGDRVSELRERGEAIREEIEILRARPDEIAAQREVLAERIDWAEGERRRAADALAVKETALAELGRRLKAAETGLADAREARVRFEAAVGAALQAAATVAERVRERLDCAPEDCLAAAGVAADEAAEDPSALESRLDRWLREREALGGVNLLAEQEATELETQIAGMNGERDDLIAAIGRLRQGIATLNKEARERLLASFDIVDRHFQELFVRLFGGGRAHLKLTDAEDPLDAGLEIYASPPGKRLQILSLLSGGEQALTATALIFAVFLTNPSPICVLDEVDAPLDEANVGRFCDLIEDMARSGATRFLIITHHRLTMARMDRLYGVTMGERGVSQLVSVDLRRAEALRGAA
ncbi:MAG TPA: chromosome partitioning protein ParA, partial [Alphaproteobacteria bacterium]|nr:chromosome partitioning protein ParA [Alphaproteobacteria bacterium]